MISQHWVLFSLSINISYYNNVITVDYVLIGAYTSLLSRNIDVNESFPNIQNTHLIEYLMRLMMEWEGT